tara:strand:- start:817 stop:2658 length:1842 start_codon:yes stop_codon:yes gene_type:complete
MPQVFSPGEGETRPLDPTEVVYSSAQKVADLLDIGPGEAVLMSKDADASAIYITGAEYRNHGFALLDKIRVYSDADPLGHEDLIVSAIGKGASTKAGSVKITFSGSITPADYQVADNAYVQNQASFTNGKTRGITKDKVDDVIRRMQDKIDNITHNSWRPNLVSAEYINFDTYKPYRRRYYTDYVGTTPLLFRNIQQILRLELWQGDSYREIGAAEAKIKFPDSVNSLTGSFVMSPGNGSSAKVTIGTATDQWRAAFDKITTAQNLADLINKEDRVGKTSVNFLLDQANAASTFTLEGSSSAVALNNEFFATANSDMGTGLVKITSMRPTKAGETASIVCTNPNITIEDCDGASTNSNSVSSDTINVSTTLADNGSIVGFNLSGGSGYTATNGVLLSGGAGTGFSVNTTVSNGVVTAITIINAGSGYLTNDELTFPNGNQGSITVTITSTSSFTDAGVCLVGAEVFSYSGRTTNAFTGCKNVIGTPLNTLASGSHTISQNRLSVDLQGSSGDQGRLRDWWIDPEMGIIYFNNSYPFFEWNAVKATYIYGERYLEKAIEDVCTKMVVIDLLLNDDRSVLIPEGTQNVDLASKIQMYKADIDSTLPRYKEVVAFL